MLGGSNNTKEKHEQTNYTYMSKQCRY